MVVGVTVSVSATTGAPLTMCLAHAGQPQLEMQHRAGIGSDDDGLLLLLEAAHDTVAV